MVLKSEELEELDKEKERFFASEMKEMESFKANVAKFAEESGTEIQELKNHTEQVRLSVGKQSRLRFVEVNEGLIKSLIKEEEWQGRDGYSREASIKIGGESLNITTWSQLIQVHLLLLDGGDFVKQMQDNEVLHDILASHLEENSSLQGKGPDGGVEEKVKQIQALASSSTF
ncbi:hypothetical protein AgCh_030443 [Apium graveolens]